jgi:hypothetical protein
VWDSVRFQAFFWLRAFSTSQAFSTPAHTRVTQTVETVEKVEKNKKTTPTHSITYEETSNIEKIDLGFFDSLVGAPRSETTNHKKFVKQGR